MTTKTQIVKTIQESKLSTFKKILQQINWYNKDK